MKGDVGRLVFMRQKPNYTEKELDDKMTNKLFLIKVLCKETNRPRFRKVRIG